MEQEGEIFANRGGTAGVNALLPKILGARAFLKKKKKIQNFSYLDNKNYIKNSKIFIFIFTVPDMIF